LIPFNRAINQLKFIRVMKTQKKIETVQDLIDELEKVQNKNAPIRVYFDPDEYEKSEKAEISMIDSVDDTFDGDRVDINLYQHPKEEQEDLETLVLGAIMKRYGGLSSLKIAMYEDIDTVLVNLMDDINDKFSEDEILLYIRKILG
jgi:hypothetical protein